MSYWSRNFRSVNIFTALPNYILLHNSVTYHINTGWARLRTCAVSVIIPFLDAAAVWGAQAFTWDHRCDDKTPSVQTANSLKFYSRQAHYVALALSTWNLDRARGTKATVAVQWFLFIFFFFFHGASRPKCGAAWLPWNSHPGVGVGPTISSRYHSISRTSSGPFPTSEVTFHVPMSRVTIKGLGRRGPRPWLPPKSHNNDPFWTLLRVVSLLEGGPTLLFRAVPSQVPWAKTQPPGVRLQAPTPGKFNFILSDLVTLLVIISCFQLFSLIFIKTSKGVLMAAWSFRSEQVNITTDAKMTHTHDT